MGALAGNRKGFLAGGSNAARSGLSLGCSLTHRGRSGLLSHAPEDMTIMISIAEYTPKLLGADFLTRH